MSKIDDIIQDSLVQGVMTQAQHDEIMLLIQEDGEIDAQEQRQLSTIFAAVKNGSLKIVDSDRALLDAEKIHVEKVSREFETQRREQLVAQSRGIASRIDDAISSGRLSQQEHDSLLALIHRDGQIDEEEKKLLSKLFAAIQAGTVHLLEGERDSFEKSSSHAREHHEHIREALERESERHQSASLHSNDAPTLSPQATIALPDTEPCTASPISVATSENVAAPIVTSEGEGSIAQLLQRARTRRTTGKTFELQNDRLLDVSLNGKVWMKTGAMVGYYGIVKFTREGVLEHGLSKMMKKAITGEGASLTKANGQGNLYLADRGKKVSIMGLGGHSLVVAGTSLLAFEETVQWDITVMKQLAAIWSGGLFNVRMSGHGQVAITTVGDPIVLRVTPSEPVMTDVHATVAWSGSLAPQIKTDVAMNTLIGRTSGETLQMRFEGDGFVIIQPYEELPTESVRSAE